MSFFSAMFGGSDTIDGPTARKLVAEGAVLVDVRSPGEFSSGHIDGAINVPVQSIPAKASAMDPAKVHVLYCASGARSAQAKSFLERSGFEKVHNLGSIRAW